MKSPLKLTRFTPKSTPLALLVLCILAFVPLVYRLGFYWDDWPSIWFLHFWGPASFKARFRARPAPVGLGLHAHHTDLR